MLTNKDSKEVTATSPIRTALESAFGATLVSFSPDTTAPRQSEFFLVGHLSDEGIDKLIDESPTFSEAEKVAYIYHLRYCGGDCGARFVAKTKKLPPPIQ